MSRQGQPPMINQYLHDLDQAVAGIKHALIASLEVQCRRYQDQQENVCSEFGIAPTLFLDSQYRSSDLHIRWTRKVQGKRARVPLVPTSPGKAITFRTLSAACPEPFHPLVGEFSAIAEQHGEAWRRVCELGKKLRSSNHLALLEGSSYLSQNEGDFTAERITSHLNGAPRAADGMQRPLNTQLQAADEALRNIKARLINEAHAMAGDWRARKEVILLEAGGWTKETRCPVNLNVPRATSEYANARPLEMRWQLVHKRHGIDGFAGPTLFKNLCMPNGSVHSSKFSKYIPAPFQQSWLEMNIRVQLVRAVWSEIAGVGELLRALAMSNSICSCVELTKSAQVETRESIRSSLPKCQRPPQWRHFRIGIKAPLHDRHNGATSGSA